MRGSWGTRPEPTPPNGECGKPIAKGTFEGRLMEKSIDAIQGSYEEGRCTKPAGHWGKC